MDFQSIFPVWNKLNAIQKNRILGGLITRKVKKGTLIPVSYTHLTLPTT